MKALVTGVTGFVGSAVARAVVEAGTEVRGLVRPGADRRALDGLAIDTVPGDLNDAASLRSALHGCRQVYHVAAHYALWARDPSVFYTVNVDGTKALLAAAARDGRGPRGVYEYDRCDRVAGRRGAGHGRDSGVPGADDRAL